MLAAVQQEPVEPDRIQYLAERLNQLQSQKIITFQEVADHVGVSRPYVSGFASGEKTGWSLPLIHRLEAFLSRYTEGETTQTHVSQVPFIITEDFKEMVTLIDDCREERLFGVIAGASGLGKSTAIQKYADSLEDVPVYRPRSSVTLKRFLKDIAELCGTTLKSQSADGMEDELTRFLRGNPRFIIIDEFGRIMRKGSMRILESLRAIREDSGKNLGVVLSGHADDFAELMSSAKAQIYSRMGPVYELQGPSKEECRKMVEPLMMTEEAKEEMATLLHRFHRQDGMRTILEELYPKAVRLSEGQTITLEMLKEAGRRNIYGYRTQHKHG